MALRRALLLFALVMAANAVDPGEVRIRSSVWVPPSARIAVESRMVEIGVTVRDRKGNPVEGLRAADFEVLDAGKPAPITLFTEQKPAGESGHAAARPAGTPPASAATTPPAPASSRSIALYFDDERTETFGLNRARTSAEKLVTTGLQGDDRVGIFTSSGLVIEEFTSNPARLLAALGRLRVHPLAGSKGIGVCPTLTRYQAYGIYAHLDVIAKDIAVQEAIACNCAGDDPDCPRRQDKVVESAAQMAWNQVEAEATQAVDKLGLVLRHLATAPGSRILLWMSPGFPSLGMERRLDLLVNEAIRARIVVNSLDSSALSSMSSEVLDNRNAARYDWAQRTMNTRQQVITELMASLAPATGGQLIRNTNDFETAVHRLTTPAEVAYVLGIAPASEPDERYHPLKVLLKKAGYKVESRTGYFAALPEKKPETAQERIDRMVVSKESATDFPATVRVSSAPVSGGQIAIKIETEVDAKGLTFAEKESRHVQQLTFVSVLEDAMGNYVTGKEAAMDLELTDGTLADLNAHGIHTNTSLLVSGPLGPGKYVVRIVIREAAKGGMVASRSPVEAH